MLLASAPVPTATPRPVFQPIVDLTRGVVRGYEALTRFDDGSLPRTVFDEATRDGWLPMLEAASLSAALARRPELPANCFLTVNVEPRGLATDEVQAVLAGAGDLRGLVVELTESTWQDDPQPVLAALTRLRGAGARIAIDDAGSDNASLQLIALVRPDFVKIDRTFVSGVDHDAGKAAVVEALGALADRLDAWVIAEGVEREAELEALIDLRVPLAQGFLLGRPGPIVDAVEHGEDIRRRAGLRDGGAPTIAALLEPAPTVLDGDELGRRAAFAASPGCRYVVSLDVHGAAVGITARGGETLRDGVLRALPTEALASIAGRTLTAGTGTTPILCHDELGRHCGIVRVERLMTELVRGLEERAGDAERESILDPLTGVLNRRGWDRRAAQESARGARYGHSSAIFSIDLDDLKAVNDRGGHAAGDRLLRRAAEVIGSRVRQFDVLARVGGDEFGLIAVECAEDGARRLAGELGAALEAAGVGASIGWALCEPDGPDLAAAWAAADASMYDRKKSGRSTA